MLWTIFPSIESGWELWRKQIEWCATHDIDHILVDSSDFRNQPEATLGEVCSKLDLPFTKSMLVWQACPEVELDNLGGRHRHLYRRVLESDGLQPAVRQPPEIESFPEEEGWREHVRECLAIYRDLSAARVVPARALVGSVDSR